MTTFRQGDLDGMCGVYALINGVNLLVPKSEDYFETFMNACIHILHGEAGNPNFFVQGIGLNEMFRLLHGVVRPNFPIHYQRPFARNARISIGRYWEACRDFLNGERKAILLALALDKYQHWTVVSSMNDKHMKFCDSGDWNAVKRASVTTKAKGTRKPVRVYPAQTFFLSCKG